MTTADDQYQAIVETCQKSQEVLNARVQEIVKKPETAKSHLRPSLDFREGESLEDFAVRHALLDWEPYESMWKAYKKRFRKPVELRDRNFSGLLFNRARFERYKFIDCDFSGSRWVFSSIKNSNCTGSNFSGISTITCPLMNTNCSNCDFTAAKFTFFAPFDESNFENANFTNAELDTSHSFFKGKEPPSKPKFKNAIMNGCKLTIKAEERPEHNTTKEEIKSLLAQIFSPEQLAVMHIDYGIKSGCFIATAVCGIDSEEVIILRHFRDSVLMDSVLGRLFVRAYYRVSPPIASLIKDSPKARYVVRNVLVRPWAMLVSRIGSVDKDRAQTKSN